MADPGLKFAFGLKPADAIEFFRRKGLNPTTDWEESAGEINNIAFAVAKVLVLNVLQKFKDAVAKALDEGQSETTFRQNLGQVAKQAIPEWRLTTVFRTNLQSAMMAGRQRQFEQNVDARPYWQYVAILDGVTRPAHRRLNGLIYRADDPFWDYYRPPIGYSCRCRIRALSDRNIEQRGLTVESSTGVLGRTPQLLSKRSGTVVDAPVMRFPDREVSPDPGFTHNKRNTWTPDLSRFDANLAEQYRRAVEGQ